MRNTRTLLVLGLLIPLASAGDDFRQALRHEKDGDRFRAAYHYRLTLAARPRLRAAIRGLERMNVTSKEALKLLYSRKKAERARGLAGVLSLDGKAKLRALAIAMRNRYRDVRTPAIAALGASKDTRAITPLIRRLVVAGGNPQSVYISSANQTSYVQDFDVEVG